jgi:hypothetical protein
MKNDLDALDEDDEGEGRVIGYLRKLTINTKYQ